MNNKEYTSYVVDIKLPPAIIVSPLLLTLGYTLVLIIDYLLIKNDRKFVSVVSPEQLRYSIFAFHFMLPVFFATKYGFGNISFMIQPWTMAAQIVTITKSNISFKEWIRMLMNTASFRDESPTHATPTEIRLDGLKKIFRWAMKFAFMKVVLDALLPEDLSSLLDLPFYSPKALFTTYMLAARIYCMLGVSDLIMGTIQSITLIRFKDVCNNPFISSSPKDFWNKRWNRFVSHLYQQFIFTKISKNQQKSNVKKNETTIRSSLTPMQCGLLIFFISGLVHDFMIAAAARTITFELTAFFLIHGIAVALEVYYRTGKYKADPTGINRVFCNLLTVLFFTTTGRLFLSPILRQPVFLEIAKRF